MSGSPFLGGSFGAFTFADLGVHYSLGIDSGVYIVTGTTSSLEIGRAILNAPIGSGAPFLGGAFGEFSFSEIANVSVNHYSIDFQSSTRLIKFTIFTAIDAGGYLVTGSNATITTSGLGGIWQNADGLFVLFGTQIGQPFNISLRPVDNEPVGKLRYDRKDWIRSKV